MSEPDVNNDSSVKPNAYALGCQSMTGEITWILSWTRSGAGVCNRLEGVEYERPLYFQKKECREGKENAERESKQFNGNS
jgi:hypothetical protein